ncbi:MAG: AzlC family ABC transporter permease [Clostridia bacterium]|nr:AzlC family ABC transporter permease [Clostridia bacterium]
MEKAKKEKQLNFRTGLIDGIPIALGYLSVSFGFGILCMRLGLNILQAVGISATNVTSAGQVAGVGIIAAAGTLIEMILTQFVINVRYSLMAISLSQKLDGTFTTPKRLLLSFGITDEIFAVAYSQKSLINTRYMAGLEVISIAGWILGTLLGASAGSILPESLINAMGLMLYGMFIAIVVPPAKKNRGILCASLIAIACSLVFYYLLPQITSGFSIILCALTASVLCALLFPVKEEEEEAL